MDTLEVKIKFIKSICLLNPKVANNGFKIGTVYALVNSINNKIYVGETYRNFKKRFKDHRYLAKHDPNRMAITKAICKYGWNSFTYYILYLTEESKNVLAILNLINLQEKHYIELFDSTNPLYGYNTTSGGDGILGYRFTEDQRKQISNRQLGKRNTSKSIKIYQFDLDLNLIKIWPSNAEIRRHFGSLIEFDKNKFTFYNSIWIREPDYTPEVLQKYKSRADQLKLIGSQKASNCKWILLYDFNGNFIAKYPSTIYASNAVGGDNSDIAKAATGKQKQSRGFVWIYEKDFTQQLLNTKLESAKSTRMYYYFTHKEVRPDDE